MNFKPTPTRCPGTARDEITARPTRLKGRSPHRPPVDGNYFLRGRMRFSLRCAIDVQMRRG